MDRPSGNVTGVTSPTDELGPKRLEIMRELLPSATAMAVLMNPGDAGGPERAKERRRRPARLGCSFMYCRPAATAIWRPRLQPQCNGVPAHW